MRELTRPGRPAIPPQLQELIRRMATEKPRWGEERIANELLLKLGIKTSPRTVRKYMSRRPRDRPRGDPHWSTFLRLHAHRFLACDFCVTITASFRMLYVFVVVEHGTRRLAHCTAAWTLQQLREVVGIDHRYRFLRHDRDSIFSRELDASIHALGIDVLRSAPHYPAINALCERVIGTLRRECLDWVVPFSETHLRRPLKHWVPHYNRGRPHMALGPSLPDPPPLSVRKSQSRRVLHRAIRLHPRRPSSRVPLACRLIKFLRNTALLPPDSFLLSTIRACAVAFIPPGTPAASGSR